MNKKIIAALLAGAMILSASSCGKKNEETTTPAATTTAETEAETTTTEAETTTETEAATEEATDTSVPENEDSAEAETNDCEKLVNAVLNSGIEFGATALVEDKEMLADVMGYDLDLIDEYGVATALMNVHLIEIAVIKPAEGKMEDVIAMLNDRKQKLLDEVAFYPAQVEAAEKTVVGSKGEYAYLICDNSAAEAEEKLIEAIG
ncbi:MAG: DUF4358 domain-containing protein [Ruminiclostridium sp.]